MRLNRLTLRNFMGVESFDFTPDGYDSTVLGRNAAGKSTLLTAYTWLLFNRDSRGSASFEVRPIIDGEVLHKMDYSVEAEFGLGDKTITLKRVLNEKWPRKRGKAFAEFAGTESTYFVDDVPRKVAEFQAVVGELFGGEKNAQVLSDPLYFAGAMPWQERRRVLLDLIPGVYDAEVIKSDEDLSELAELLDGRSIDDLRDATKAKRTEHKRSLDTFEGRIREASIGANPAAPAPEAAKAKLTELEAAAAEGAQELQAARDTERRAFELVQEARMAHAQATLTAQADVNKRRAAIEAELRSLKSQAHAVVTRGNRIKDEGTCPECGQPIDKKHAAAEKKRLRAEYDTIIKQVEALQAENDDLTAPQVDDAEYQAAKAAHEKAVAALNAVTATDLSDEIAVARAELHKAEQAAQAKRRVAELKADEKRVAAEYEEAERVLALCEAFVAAKVRLVEGQLNSLFRTVRWKLFEEQVNGGIKEIADATVNGVPWGNLNTGARMNAGLDIISVLSGNENMSLPVWIDNAEALTGILPIDSQVIQLRVSEDDPELRVVIEQQRKAKAA